MPSKVNILGNRYGMLTVIGEAPHKGRRTAWYCKCDCGNVVSVATNHLRNNKTKSCGCTSLSHVNAKADLVGHRFGRLTVLRRGVTQNSNRTWVCKCECGNLVTLPSNRLLSGGTKSCGCLLVDVTRERSTTHGGASRNNRDRLWGIWAVMKDRCANPNNKSYRNYGALGVTVCDEWLNDYEAFREWAYANGYDENAPKQKHTCTLDRINPYGNYEPSNCRWTDAKTQANNTRKKWKGEINVSRGAESQRLAKQKSNQNTIEGVGG